ncbi:MAG: hypothetical protein GW855_08075 [Erythrobacter sp.]|nr:hypothetical protein [Erythrobacter sp.]NCQ63179.1 hypothetical protein [Alphaproteobacteria bacterium]
MIANLLPLVFLAAQAVQVAPATDGLGPLPADQQGAIRCSAAFALIAERQKQGDADALEYPPLAERGREFFVQSGARLMDDAGLTRTTIEARMRAEARAILQEGTLDQLMPPCLMLLEASGL